MNEEQEMTAEVATPEVTVDELEQSITQEAQQEAAQQAEETDEALAAEIRAGIAELFEDGWTTQELSALAQDEQVRQDIADGHSVTRAAAGWLRRCAQSAAAARKHGVPTSRMTAAGRMPQDNRIEQMTDAQFDAFSRRARAAMMEGKKVRL